MTSDWKIALPAGIVDPHVHQWDPFTSPREVSREARLLRHARRVPRALRYAVPKADREFIGNPHHVLKPYLPATYDEDRGTLPVDEIVHIEAAWPIIDHRDAVDETRWVASLPFGDGTAPRLGAIVAHVDPRWSDTAQILDEHLSASKLVRGVRHSVAHHPDPGVRNFDLSDAAYSEPDFLDGFAAIAERGLSFELWCYAHQLPSALVLVERYPETAFVLDHYATPVGVLGPRGRHTARYAHERRAQFHQWREDVAALAARPNVVAKHSGLGMPSLGAERRRPLTDGQLHSREGQRLLDRVGPMIEHVHDCFGTRRAMWASNFPIDKPGLSLPATLRMLLDVLGSSADTEQLTCSTARRVYRLDSGETVGRDGAGGRAVRRS